MFLPMFGLYLMNNGKHTDKTDNKSFLLKTNHRSSENLPGKNIILHLNLSLRSCLHGIITLINYFYRYLVNLFTKESLVQRTSITFIYLPTCIAALSVTKLFGFVFKVLLMMRLSCFIRTPCTKKIIQVFIKSIYFLLNSKYMSLFTFAFLIPNLIPLIVRVPYQKVPKGPYGKLSYDVGTLVRNPVLLIVTLSLQQYQQDVET